MCCLFSLWLQRKNNNTQALAQPSIDPIPTPSSHGSFKLSLPATTRPLNPNTKTIWKSVSQPKRRKIENSLFSASSKSFTQAREGFGQAPMHCPTSPRLPQPRAPVRHYLRSPARRDPTDHIQFKLAPISRDIKATTSVPDGEIPQLRRPPPVTIQ